MIITIKMVITMKIRKFRINKGQGIGTDFTIEQVDEPTLTTVYGNVSTIVPPGEWIIKHLDTVMPLIGNAYKQIDGMLESGEIRELTVENHD